MSSVFLAVLNMSLTGAFVIAAVCLGRLLLKKAPKVVSYYLWVVVAVRLIMPFSIESVWSLVPFSAQPITPTSGVSVLHMPGAAYVPNNSGGFSVPIPIPSDILQDGVLTAHHRDVMLAESPAGTVAEPAPSRTWAWYEIAAYVWLLGTAIMFLYGVVSYHVLKRKMRGSVCVRNNIYEADNIKSPFVLGFFTPRIYLPVGLSEQERGYVILHEQIHIRRLDHIVKFAAYMILCVHWFNPLAWLAFRLMGADMEMSCDERVLREMQASKTEYSMSLVALATEAHFMGSPLAFGEGSIKERVKNVLNFKKRHKIVTIIAVALAVVFGAGLMLNQASAAVQVPGWVDIESDEPVTVTQWRYVFRNETGEDWILSDSPPKRWPDSDTSSGWYIDNEPFPWPDFEAIAIYHVINYTDIQEPFTVSSNGFFATLCEYTRVFFARIIIDSDSGVYEVQVCAETYEVLQVIPAYEFWWRIPEPNTNTAYAGYAENAPAEETPREPFGQITGPDASIILRNHFGLTATAREITNAAYWGERRIFEVFIVYPASSPEGWYTADIDANTGVILRSSSAPYTGGGFIPEWWRPIWYGVIPRPTPPPSLPPLPDLTPPPPVVPFVPPAPPEIPIIWPPQATPHPVNSIEDFIYAREMLRALGDEITTIGTEMTAMGIEMGRLGARLAFREMEALGVEMEALGVDMGALGEEMNAWGTGMTNFANSHPVSAQQAFAIALEYAGLTSANSWSQNADVVNNRLVWSFSFWNRDSTNWVNHSWANTQRTEIIVDAITGEPTRIN